MMAWRLGDLNRHNVIDNRDALTKEIEMKNEENEGERLNSQDDSGSGSSNCSSGGRTENDHPFRKDFPDDCIVVEVLHEDPWDGRNVVEITTAHREHGRWIHRNGGMVLGSCIKGWRPAVSRSGHPVLN